MGVQYIEKLKTRGAKKCTHQQDDPLGQGGVQDGREYHSGVVRGGLVGTEAWASTCAHPPEGYREKYGRKSENTWNIKYV